MNNSEKNEKKIFSKRCYGIVILKSENSNWNADFTKYPRRLPDENATIFATDKALKYSIRRYWKDKGLNVFVWRTYREDGVPRSLSETDEYWKDKLGTDKFEMITGKKGKEMVERKSFFNNFIDVKFFGITFAKEDENFSIIGPLQISYGINKYNINTPYVVDIASPYRVDKEKSRQTNDKEIKEESRQTTLGNEIRNLKSYYVYDWVLNPRNLPEKMHIYEDEIHELKEALKKSVTYHNTTTKIGTENALLLFITLKEESNLVLPTMKNLVEITSDEIINLSRIRDLLSKHQADIESVELYYNDMLAKITGTADNWIVCDILK